MCRPTSNVEVRVRSRRASASRTLPAVALQCALAIALAAAQTLDTVRVTTATASIRAEPKATAVILTTVKAGASLEVRAVEGEWFKIAMFVGPVRIEGYVSKRSVTTEKAPPAATFDVSASVEVGGKPQGLTPLVARVVRLAARADSPREAAIAMPIGQGSPLPAARASLITYVWVIDTVANARAVSTPRPAFVLQFGESGGISPADFSPAVIRLVGTPAGPRVMSALRGRVDQASRALSEWDVARDLRQEVVPSSVESVDRGIVKIAPDADLEAGEYAIVLRPTGNRKFAGTSVLSAAKDGRAFGILWAFLVK